MIPRASAPRMNSTAAIVVARDRTVAPLRAPKAAWLVAAAKCVGDVAALALLEQDDQHQHQADQHVENRGEVVQHRPLSLQRKRYYTAAVRLRETISKNARTSRLAPPTSAPSTSGQRDQIPDVLGLDAAAIQDVAEFGRLRPEPLPQPLPDMRMRLGRLRRRGIATGPDRPDRLVGNDQQRHLSAVRPSSPCLIWRSSTSNVSLRSRWSSVSPMQAIGVSPAAKAAATLRLTVASVSPNSVRRSEWPTMTYSAPASRTISALTSPVKAPSRSQ